MKNTFTVLLVVFLSVVGSAGVAFAQNGPEADKTSAQVSKKMLQVLRLNELEYIKVKELNFARISKMTEAVTKFSQDHAGLETRLAEIEKEFETNLAAVLKKETLMSYANFKMTPEGDVLAMMKKTPAPAQAPVK